MWLWIAGGAAALFLISRASTAGASIHSRFVGTTNGVQHVLSSPSILAKFQSELTQYHVFGAGAEKLGEGALSLKGKRDVGAVESNLPRLFSAVQKAAGDAKVNSTLMLITDLDALIDGRKPMSITIYVATVAEAKQKAAAGSKLAIID